MVTRERGVSRSVTLTDFTWGVSKYLESLKTPKMSLQYRCHVTSTGIPTEEIRWSYNHLISTMVFLIPVRQHIHIESGPWGPFQKHHKLLNLRALKFSPVNKSTSFNVWARYFVWNFKGTLWNSTQNILPIHWKIWFLYNIDLRAHTCFGNAASPPPPPRSLSCTSYAL